MTQEDIQEIVRRLEAVGFSVRTNEYVWGYTAVKLSVSGDLTAELQVYNSGTVWVHVADDDLGYEISPTSVDEVITMLRDTLLIDAEESASRADMLRAHAGRLA